MPSRKNPIDQVKDLLVEALTDPKGAAETAVDTARETAATGKMMAGQLSRFAISEAGALAGDLLSRVVGSCANLWQSTADESAASGPIAVPDPDAPDTTSAAAAATVPAQEPATKPVKKKTAKKAAKKATAKDESGSDMPTPADVTEKIASTNKTAAKKSSANRNAKKAAEQGAGAASPAESSLPRSATDVRDSDDVDVTTSVGTSAAGTGTNPDTDEHDLQQPGTPPLMDPGTIHAVQSEAEILQKAADPDKG